MPVAFGLPRKTSALLLILAGTLGPRALASGFQLREQSPSAQGNSFAGISAGGSDIGSMFFNVATLTRFQGNEIVGGFSLIQPSARMENGSASRANGSPISGNASSGDAGRSGVLPVFYGLWSLSPDLKLGFSLNSPFGLTSEYDPAWIGRYHALKSTMTIVELAPNVAYRISARWSAGAALVARHVDAELSNAIDLSAIGAPDGKATVTGQRWGLGYKLGLLFEPRQDLRFGAAYLSAIDFRLKGEVVYEGVPDFLRTHPSYLLKDGGARPMANQPAMASLGAAWELTPAFTLQAEAARTFWSHFQDIRITFDSGQKDSFTEENWKDSWFLSLGLTWRPSEAWTVRTGVAKDQTPTTDRYRTPRIPDADRTWASLGAGYAFTKAFSLDLAYSHLFAKDSTLELKAGAQGSPDFVRGDLSGTYRNKVDILALQARLKF